MENLYYHMIYQLISDPAPVEGKAVHLRRLNAKIIRLNAATQRGILLDTHEADRMPGEDISIH
jgi:hypothetical protein